MHTIDLKARILDYLHHLTIYDYVAYGWLMGVLLGMILLAIVLISSKPKFALTLILLVLLLMMIGPFAMKYGLDKTVRKVTLIDQNTTYLPFSKNLIVLGKIKNLGKIEMQGCRVFVDIVRIDENKYKTLLYRLKPIRKEMLKIVEPLKVEGTIPYRVVFDHFATDKKYAVRQEVECY